MGRFNVLVILFATLGSVTVGYCNGIIGTTLGESGFVTYFNLDDSDSTGLIGAINGLYQTGGLFGCLSAGWTADQFGRRKALFIASCFAILGSALQAGSVHVAMFILARFITALGSDVGAIVTIVPMWQSEVAPPKTRGFLVGMHGVFILSGYTIAAWIGVGFSYVQGVGVQWRVPLAIQAIPPLLLACGVLFLPESPRWLVENNEGDRALAILKKIHHDPNNANEAFATAEFTQIKTQLALEKTLPSSWWSIFTVPSYRKRAIIGFSTMFCCQATGTLVIANYGSILYTSLGFGGKDQLLLTAGWISFGPPLNFINALLMDRVGRKNLMVFGLTGVAVSLLLECITNGLYGIGDNHAGQKAAIFFIFLHIGFYAPCLDATTYVYASEIWPTHLRAKGCAISTAGLYLGSLIVLTAAPTAFAVIGWKYYVCFLCATIYSIFLFQFYFVETKGLSLEEVAQRFGDQVVRNRKTL
ncbi:sugar transporter family protein [Hypoxylon rubiginosum]|uniref:Sugar transporter family protein n=1 Tax=Hypoxylon rubiginosum TaxID=110542 RepID=A0ACB9ZCV4_9PEZI|nr:sugar transporter family protein [Hypoxylon rubiginosum]